METHPTEYDEANTVGRRCLHVRVSRAFQDVSGVFQAWQDKCEELLVVEHQADAKVKRTHCHILLVEPTVKNDQLQKPLRELNLKGNKGDFMFSFVVIKGRHKGEPIKREKEAIYMIKGRYEVLMNKGFTQQELEHFKAAWMDIQDQGEDAVKVPKNKDDTEWDYFLTKYEISKQDLTMIGIKRWIRSDCLSRRKPVPRGGDVNRWAFSLYAITNNKTKMGDQEDLEEYANNQLVKID